MSFDERIPKRHCKENDCLLCKQHGGTHTAHNTLDCRKYKSNGTPKKNFYGKEACVKSHGHERPHQGRRSYVQLSTKIKKLEKYNKKMKLAQKKKHKHCHHSSNSNDSSSS